MISLKEKRSLKQDVRQLEKVDGRRGADTIRLWESYREQAYLWRALALLQMPATALAIAVALVMYITADTIIEVPHMPQPGHYSTKQLPDAIFISTANELVNGLASYQPTTARNQFMKVRDYLWEPALTAFEDEIIKKELVAIEETRRSQLFFVNKDLVRVERYPHLDQVVVRMPGTRQKMIGQRTFPQDEIVFYLKMTTIPRHNLNPHGIVVFDIRLKKMSSSDLRRIDQQSSRQKILRKGNNSER